MHARIHRSVKVCVVWSIVLLASPYLDAQSAVPELSVQLKAEGYSPESCISSPPSAYVTGDTTVHINVVNDLQVELQPAYLDLDGRLRLLQKKQANSSWNDSTYAQTIWVWLDDTNKKCLGTTQISDVATQSKIIRLSELSRQQIHVLPESRDNGNSEISQETGYEILRSADSVCEQNPRQKNKAGYWLRICKVPPGGFSPKFPHIKIYYYNGRDVSSPRMRYAGKGYQLGEKLPGEKSWKYAINWEDYPQWAINLDSDLKKLIASDLRFTRMSELPAELLNFRLPYWLTERANEQLGLSNEDTDYTVFADIPSGQPENEMAANTISVTRGVETPNENVGEDLSPISQKTSPVISEDRIAPNIGERLALVIAELNSAKRMYNDQYELKEVRMDYENQELNYLFSVRDSVSELDVSMLAMVAKSTYCSASKLELFREENIPAIWIYADSSGEELRIPTWTIDCE